MLPDQNQSICICRLKRRLNLIAHPHFRVLIIVSIHQTAAGENHRKYRIYHLDSVRSLGCLCKEIQLHYNHKKHQRICHLKIRKPGGQNNQCTVACQKPFQPDQPVIFFLRFSNGSNKIYNKQNAKSRHPQNISEHRRNKSCRTLLNRLCR